MYGADPELRFSAEKRGAEVDDPHMHSAPSARHAFLAVAEERTRIKLQKGISRTLRLRNKEQCSVQRTDGIS